MNKGEADPASREGIVFRESERLARALGQKAVPAGSFQFLDTESVKYELTREVGGVSNLVRSTLTGEIVNRGSFIIPEGTWSVQETLEGFKERTEEFITSYFGKGTEPEERVVDYQDMLDRMKIYLKDLKKKR